MHIRENMDYALGSTLSIADALKEEDFSPLPLNINTTKGKSFFSNSYSALMSYNFYFFVPSTKARFAPLANLSLEIVMISVLFDQDKVAIWAQHEATERLIFKSKKFTKLERTMRKNLHRFSLKLLHSADIYKGFYRVEQSDRLSDENKLLKRWVKDLFTEIENLEEVEKAQLLRLIAFHSVRSINLFTYDWEAKSQFADQDLFSSLLSGMNIILQQSLHRGDMEEIHLKQAVLLVEKSDKYPVAFVLVVNKATQVVRDALRVFAKRFNEDFADYYSLPEDTAPFSTATSLVEECFPP